LILYVALCSIISYNYGGASGPQTGATPHRINLRDNNIKRLTTTQQYFSQYPKKIRPECRVTGRDNKNPNNFFHTVFCKSISRRRFESFLIDNLFPKSGSRIQVAVGAGATAAGPQNVFV
jgi:hypothetical protein